MLVLDYKKAFVWARYIPTSRIAGLPCNPESTVRLIHRALKFAMNETNTVIRIKNIHITTDV